MRFSSCISDEKIEVYPEFWSETGCNGRHVTLWPTIVTRASENDVKNKMADLNVRRNFRVKM